MTNTYYLILHFPDSQEVKKVFKRKNPLKDSEIDTIMRRYYWRYGKNIDLVKRIATMRRGP